MRNGLLIDWGTAAAMLANEPGDVQAHFFKSFVREMRTWPTRHQQEAQLAAVNQELTEDEKELLSMLGFRGCL
jgi:ubiquinone biosynthesis protein UbiJ